MFKDDIFAILYAVESKMLEFFEDIIKMCIDEGSAKFSRIGISDQFASAARDNRESAVSDRLEQVIGITQIDLILELIVQS